jgi:hypothetical protein
MPLHPPAYCARCRLVFPATAIALENSTVSFRNSTTNCPRCSGSAEILDGTYNAIGSRLQMFLAESVSDEARNAILALVTRVQAAEISLDEAKTEAQKIDRRLAKIFDISHWSPEVRATLFGSILVAGATLAAPMLTLAPRVEPHIEILVPAPQSRAASKHPSTTEKRKKELTRRLLYGTSPLTAPLPPSQFVPRAKK